MLNIEFAQPTDTILSPPRIWSGEFWYTTMSINIPANVDVLVVRWAARAQLTNVSLGHQDTGSFMTQRSFIGDSNLHWTYIYDMTLPPCGPTKLYLRSIILNSGRIVVDYLKNVNIKTEAASSTFQLFTSTASVSPTTSPGDIVMDVVKMGRVPTASVNQIVQVNSQDDPVDAAIWYGASYTIATGSTTTMRWVGAPSSVVSQATVVYTPSPGGRMDVTSAGQNQIIVSDIPSQGSLITVV